MTSLDSLKVLFLFDSPYEVDIDYSFSKEFQLPDWKVERQVYRALKKNGWGVHCVGIHNDIGVLFSAVKKHKPDVIFNLAEVFNQMAHFEQHVIAAIEMLEVPFTGASSTCV